MREPLASRVAAIVQETPVTDMHTHLYSDEFGALSLWELDDLLTYHYLIAEAFRWLDMPYESFWQLSKREQAELIWQTLFVERSPISEAASGLLHVFRRLGLDTSSRDLATYREAWSGFNRSAHIDSALQLTGVRELVMTNDPLDPAERAVWLARGEQVQEEVSEEVGKQAGEQGGKQTRGCNDPRFHAALRVDPLLNNWPQAWQQLAELGYAVEEAWSPQTVGEVRRFLREWAVRMDALYMAVSMPGDFTYPAGDHRSRMLDDAMLPVCRELGIAFGLMVGVRRAANPELRLAGDMGMASDAASVEALCRRYPEQKFLVTMLARENQHELAVLARKFRNLMPFGCWWFLHIESMVHEMTAMRLELLGLSVIPQHSDCRVVGQLLYKWDYSKRIISQVLTQKYERLLDTGWQVTEGDIRRDCEALLGGNFWQFIGKPPGRGKAQKEREA